MKLLFKIFRTKSRAAYRLNFEDHSQTFTITSLTKKSVEDANISLQVRRFFLQ